MIRSISNGLAVACLVLPLCAAAQSTPAKKELVKRVLAAQQGDLETVARSIVERPAAQMAQGAGAAIQQLPADKREAVAKSIEAEIKKYVDESYPLVRERAIKDAPSTIGATMEEKMSEDELKQYVAWVESPAAKKVAQIGPEMRNVFIQKVLNDSRPAVDPKVQALDAKIRSLLGLPPAPAADASAPAMPAAPAAKPAASRPKAGGK